ncbi:hypothetical protein GCM10029976_009970 [Kribbella albertanoniae]|uniref:Secreted protein n=1 Tax=Kribbella albertanoniae TaxID=1266829 RepID=A0A4R4Q363_9ACTN|nr:hypothetical protein [Kribbella albertanoniae]TDC29282.1 hypothetical protein E1261_16225 [Kribbella albertanoniae]
MSSTTALIRKGAATLAATAALATGAAVVTATPAEATVSSCGNGRCTVYLSKSETRALANARVPAPPAAVPAQLKAAYYALAWGHVWFAGQYANRGWCSAFTISIYPWETQGYYGYACNWE